MCVAQRHKRRGGSRRGGRNAEEAMIRREGDRRGGLPLARGVDLRREESSPPRYFTRRGGSQRGVHGRG